ERAPMSWGLREALPDAAARARLSWAERRYSAIILARAIASFDASKKRPCTVFATSWPDLCWISMPPGLLRKFAGKPQRNAYHLADRSAPSAKSIICRKRI